MLVKVQDGGDFVMALAPVRLGRGTVQVGGIYLVADGRDGLEDRETCLREIVEQVVASVARGIDTNLQA